MNHIHYFVKTILVSLILLTTVIPIHTAAFIFIDDGKYKTALCNSCNDMQMQAAAVSAIPSGGNVHVIDFKKNKIKAFNTQSEPGKVTIVEADVNKEVVKAVAQLYESVQFMRNVGIGGTPLSDIQPYTHRSKVIGSAHSLAYNSYEKHDVADALAEYLISSKVGVLKASADTLGLRLVSSVIPINHIYTIMFADGTTYRFVFKELDVDGLTGEVTISIEPNKNSGRDGDVVLPERSNGGYAGFDTAGSTTSMARLLEYAKSRGIIINYQGGATKTTTTIIDCNEGPDGKITCQAKK